MTSDPMTQGKSLVEDMARAMLAVERSWKGFSWDDLPAYARDIFLRNATAALAVLKDRLPADDRELVERLGDVLDIVAAAEQAWAKNDDHRNYYAARHAAVQRAADRIIAYSASLERCRARLKAVLNPVQTRSSHDQP